MLGGRNISENCGMGNTFHKLQFCRFAFMKNYLNYEMRVTCENHKKDWLQIKIIHITARIICLITFRFFILFIIRFSVINLHQHAYVHSLIDNNFIFFPRIPLCKLINQHLSALAQKFPDVKFLKSVSSVCIPNYPDKNLPTLFVYYEGDLKKQYVGPMVFGGMNFKQDGKENIVSMDCVNYGFFFLLY